MLFPAVLPVLVTALIYAVVSAIVSIGLMYGIRAIQGKKKPRQAPLDESPTTLSTRGSYIPYLVGRHKVAPIVCWAGDRNGPIQHGSAPPQYRESAWHALCVGPASTLYRIVANGKTIWEAPKLPGGPPLGITPATHPSGTWIQIGATPGTWFTSTNLNPLIGNMNAPQNRFYIYWGEEDQPINTLLGFTGSSTYKSRVGINSRWPLVCYILWINKTLDGSVWHDIQYEIEVEPAKVAPADADVGLSESVSFTAPVNQAGTAFAIRDTRDGGPGTGYLYVVGDQTAYLTPNAPVVVAGQPGSANGNYLVLSSSYSGAFIDTGLILKDFFQSGFPQVWHPDPTGPTAIPQATPPPPLGIPGQAYRLAATAAPQAWVHPCSVFLPENEPQRFQVFISRDVSGGGGTASDEVTLFFGTSIPSPSTPVREALFTWDGLSWVPPAAAADENIQAADMGGGWWLLSYEYASDVDDAGDIRTVGVRVEDLNSALMGFSPVLWETGGTKVLLQQSMTGFLDNQGTLTLYTSASYGGPNPAHVIAQMLFQDWPHGLALPQSLFDMDSLELVGTTMVSADEAIYSHVFLDGGEAVQDGLSMLMEDVGLFLVWVPEKGKFAFSLIREPGTLGNRVFDLTEDDLSRDHIPEVETVHFEERPNRITFNFLDRLRNYRVSTIPYDDDGATLYRGIEGPSGSSTNMETVREFFSAERVSKRRAAEALAAPVRVKVKAARSARRIPVGSSIQIPDFPLDVFLRVVASKPEEDSDLVELECVVDFYAVSPASFSAGDGGGQALSGPPPTPDIQFTWQEVSRFKQNDGVHRIYIPRVRSLPEALTAGLWFDDHGTGGGYREQAVDASIFTGGLLVDAMPARASGGPYGWMYLATGPEIEILGSDANKVEDLTLSGFEEAYWKGRQWMLIGDEVMWVQQLLPLGSGSFQTVGVVRGRLGTERAAHAANDEVYIFRYDELPKIPAPFPGPGSSIQLPVKTEPRVWGRGVDLDDVTAVVKDVKGDAVRPMRPDGLRTTSPGSFSWLDGGTLELIWDYRVPSDSGAGLQGAGEPTGQEPYQGTFRLELWRDSGGGPSSKLATIVSGYAPPGLQPAFDYPDSVLMADVGGGAPASGAIFSIWIKVFNVGAGLDSDPCQAMFSKWVP